MKIQRNEKIGKTSRKYVTPGSMTGNGKWGKMKPPLFTDRKVDDVHHTLKSRKQRAWWWGENRVRGICRTVKWTCPVLHVAITKVIPSLA